MSFKSSNKRDVWKEYCSTHSELLGELKLNKWVVHSEENFREFATYGYVDSYRQEVYSFSALSEEGYYRLYSFMSNYFDMNMIDFSSFKERLSS